jgi:hypothetical protein
MRRHCLLILGSIIVLANTACTPSTRKVISWRRKTPNDKVVKRQEKLLECVGARGEPKEPSKKTLNPVWRAETMRTMTHLDRQGTLAGQQPRLHSQLEQFLRREYASPRASSDEHDVRAWAVYCLGHIDQPKLVSFFVEVLAENKHATDPGYMVCLAALHSLHPHIDDLKHDAGLRKRMLLKLATMKADLRQVGGGDQAKSVRQAVTWFERELQGYGIVVELLPPAGTQGTNVAPLLEILDWNYQRLAIGDHLQPDGRAVPEFDINCTKLLSLAWHRDAEVRRRSRIILERFAPQKLFENLAQRLIEADNPLTEDFEHFANLLATTDTLWAAGSEETTVTEYSDIRQRAIASVFRQISSIPLDSRSLIYSRLLECEPEGLAKGLLAINSAVLEEPEANVLQQLRTLGLVRNEGRAVAETGMDIKLAKALAAFMRRPSLLVRQQVVAHLLDTHPIILSAGCIAPLETIGSEPTTTADYLVDTYLSCLELIEQQNQSDDSAGRTIQDVAEADCGVLRSPYGRPEFAIKAKIAHFLRPRRGDLLLEFACDDLAGKVVSGGTADIREVALLGDIVECDRAKLEADTCSTCVNVLRQALCAGDEEQALLCARYLLHLGESISTSQAAQLPASAALLVKLHQNTGPAPSADEQGGSQ